MSGSLACSRRRFLHAGIAASATLPAGAADSAEQEPRGSTEDADSRELVSRADLVYDKPAARSEEGIPIGNGRMGTLVWTTPAALRFQINRADVYPMNSATASFFERNSDYCGGCGFVDVDFASASADVFPAAGFRQHLSVYDGLLTMNGDGVKTRILAWHHRDVMALDIDDRRQAAEPVSINLRMLRFASQYFSAQRLEAMTRDHIVAVRTRNHTAASQLLVSGGRIVLTQEFREGSHYNKSAVAIGVVGRNAKPKFADETELRLVVPPGSGQFTILIASASSFDPQEDAAAMALQQLEAAAAAGFAELVRDNADWWHAFWRRGVVRLRSDDGAAQFIEQQYHYFLYLMASTSRGKYPPKFNGMLWNTGGDLRAWGSQHWFANLSCYYEAIPATNRLELLDPVFDMYSGMYEKCSLAARQQWGSEGMFIPETTWFDGLAKLPDDIAREMQDLYLMRKPWEQRSQRFIEYSLTRLPHSSRWNWYGSGAWVEGRWVPKDRGEGPFGPVTHILGTTAKVAYLFWRRYEYTLDTEWLRARAYPMLKAAAEFYRNFPNLKKGADGKYHIHHVNSNESVRNATDTDEDLSAMRGILPAAIRAAGLLNVDPELRAAWRELFENLAPLPVSDHPDALKPAGYSGPRVFVRALRPVVTGGGLLPDGNSLPHWFFDLCNSESSDAQLLAVANATFDASFRSGLNAKTPVGVLSKIAIAGSTLGRADAVRYLIPNQMRILTRERQGTYGAGGALRNRLALREGVQALDAQSLGRAAEALHLALLQSGPPAPAEVPVIRLFPAWPKEWDASFRLLARGAFIVSSSIRRGRVEYVELESQAGAGCRLRNPWGGAEVVLRRNGRTAETLAGTPLAFATSKREKIRIVPVLAGA